MKLREFERQSINAALPLFAEYMQAVAEREHQKVNQAFDLDRLDDMFCGGNADVIPKAHEAVELLNNLWDKRCEKQASKHEQCDQLGCGQSCPRTRIQEAIQERLMVRFEITVFYLLG